MYRSVLRGDYEGSDPPPRSLKIKKNLWFQGSLNVPKSAKTPLKKISPKNVKPSNCVVHTDPFHLIS